MCYNGNMADKITWSNEKRKLSELVPWERNPRQITDKQAKRLEESFEQFGQVEIIAIGPENQIYNGHQRLKVLSQKYGSNYEVDVRVASRALTEKEREKLTVLLHKGATGEWNFDTLANEFEVDELVEWGFSPSELGITPDADEWGAAMDKLPDEDRAPFQQMTFTLHDTQAETVKDALTASKALGAFVETENENSNGNALARICEMFLEENGRG